MPENTVYVGRPSLWKNPYRVGDIWDQSRVWDLPSWSELDTRNGETRITAPLAVDMFRREYGWMAGMPRMEMLRGKDLACWCPESQPCHADVLLEWANS